MPHDPLTFDDARAFDRWLRTHHADSPGAWLRLAKKGAPAPTITYADAVEVALCWGWIDGQRRSLDATHTLQRFTPRRPRSRWSKINRAKAEALIAAGRMRPPGLREVERARADGRWESAYDPPSQARVPPDLAAALARNRKAAALFAALDSANRFAVLYRVQAPKRPETRARKIAELVEMLARGETIHPRRATLRSDGQRDRHRRRRAPG